MVCLSGGDEYETEQEGELSVGSGDDVAGIIMIYSICLFVLSINI
jgi:hypothetical protein